MNGETPNFDLENIVKTRRWLQFTNITLCIYKLGYNLAPEGQRHLFRLIYQYITTHKNSRWISRQSFAFSPEIVSFTVLSRDAERIQRAITEILKAPNSLTTSFCVKNLSFKHERETQPSTK